jgi:Helix-turn-helix domain
MAGDDFNLLGAQRAVFGSGLAPLEKLVALALLDHWSRRRDTFPSAERLAKWTSLCRRSVLRSLAALEAKGAIAVTRSHGRANRYELGPLMAVTSAPQSPVPVSHQCPTVTTPVTDSHPTSAPQSPEGILVRTPPKEPICAPLSRKRKTAPEKVPVVGAHELKIHYLSEFQKYRTAEAKFSGSQWSRAMKALGELVTSHGLEESKRIVSAALQQLPTPTFTPKVNPWDIAANANNHKATVAATGRGRYTRGPAQQTGVDVFAGVKAVGE